MGIRYEGFTDDERALYADRKWPRPKCDVCGKPLVSLETSALVFDYWKPAERRRGEHPFIAHFDCFDDGGTYVIPLHRIAVWGNDANPHAVRDSVCMWRAHLGDKDWWRDDAATDLVRAWGFATAIIERKGPRGSRVNPSPALRARVLERDGFRCRRCGNGTQHARLVVDHVVPVTQGGKTTEGNLQTLCEPCNQGKAARPPHPHDFLS